MPKPTDGEILNALNRNLPSEALIGEAAVAVMRIINAAWAERESGDDLERHNREQRIRREAYAEGLAPRHLNPLGRKREAARRYPLKKRVPKVIDDPHGTTAFGWWRVKDTGHGFHFSGNENGPWHDVPSDLGWTHTRVRALSALLVDPFTVEEDTSVEDVDSEYRTSEAIK